jgi:hypothetical protein
MTYGFLKTGYLGSSNMQKGIMQMVVVQKELKDNSSHMVLIDV